MHAETLTRSWPGLRDARSATPRPGRAEHEARPGDVSRAPCAGTNSPPSPANWTCILPIETRKLRGSGSAVDIWAAARSDRRQRSAAVQAPEGTEYRNSCCKMRRRGVLGRVMSTASGNSHRSAQSRKRVASNLNSPRPKHFLGVSDLGGRSAPTQRRAQNLRSSSETLTCTRSWP